MVAIPSRHRSLALLAGVLLFQVLMLAVQVKRDSRGRLIRVWTITAVTPFEKGGAWGFDKVRGVWDHYFALQGTTRQNEALKAENDALKLRISQLESKAAEADRLSALLAFKQAHDKVPMLMARVIGASAGTASRTVEIDRGERDGVRRNMAVITPDGAVGKIIEVYRDNAQVLLLTDKDSGAGAMLLATRIQSPVKGNGDPTLSMSYVANDDAVNVGDKVVTSGMDKIFPRDIPVGTVIEVKPGTTFKAIRVKPTANMERLEEVIVLLTQEPVDFPTDTSAQGAAAASDGSAAAPATQQNAPVTTPTAEKP
jgi:rod shape-determining protein MreC